MTGERDEDVDLEREAGRAAVEPRGDAAQHARLLEPPDPVHRRGGREPDEAGELDVRAAGIDLELMQQPDVDFVERRGHRRKNIWSEVACARFAAVVSRFHSQWRT
jgi:hypothetical protein